MRKRECVWTSGVGTHVTARSEGTSLGGNPRPPRWGEKPDLPSWGRPSHRPGQGPGKEPGPTPSGERRKSWESQPRPFSSERRSWAPRAAPDQAEPRSATWPWSVRTATPQKPGASPKGSSHPGVGGLPPPPTPTPPASGPRDHDVSCVCSRACGGFSHPHSCLMNAPCCCPGCSGQRVNPAPLGRVPAETAQSAHLLPAGSER